MTERTLTGEEATDDLVDDGVAASEQPDAATGWESLPAALAGFRPEQVPALAATRELEPIYPLLHALTRGNLRDFYLRVATLEAVAGDGRSPIKPAELDEVLYWLSESARGQVLRTLRASGWLSYEGEGGYRLTDAGRFVATVLSFLRARVREGSLLPTVEGVDYMLRLGVDPVRQLVLRGHPAQRGPASAPGSLPLRAHPRGALARPPRDDRSAPHRSRRPRPAQPPARRGQRPARGDDGGGTPVPPPRRRADHHRHHRHPHAPAPGGAGRRRAGRSATGGDGSALDRPGADGGRRRGTPGPPARDAPARRMARSAGAAARRRRGGPSGRGRPAARRPRPSAGCPPPGTPGRLRAPRQRLREFPAREPAAAGGRARRGRRGRGPPRLPGPCRRRRGRRLPGAVAAGAPRRADSRAHRTCGGAGEWMRPPASARG